MSADRPPNLPTVLLAGFEPSTAERLAGEIDARRVSEVGEETIDLVATALPVDEARVLVDRVLETPGGASTLFLVLAAGDRPEIFQDLLDADRLYFLTATPPSEPAVAALLAGALDAVRRKSLAPSDAADEPGRSEHGDAGEIASSLRRLAACVDLSDAVRVAGRDAAARVDADEGACWLFDVGGHTLFAPGPGGDRQASAAAGLASFAARTGTTVRVENASADPRHDADVDTPDGTGDERLLAVPLALGSGAAAERAGVLVATRAADRPAFESADERRLERFARRAAPLLLGFLDERRGAESGVGTGVFRRAALEHHSRGAARDGRPLEMTPVWIARTYQLLLALLAVALAFVLFGRHDEYASGPAVVRVEDRIDVTSPIAGTAVDVEVEAGESVEEGQLLARFYDQREAAELRRLRRELDALLADRLRDPSDLVTARAVSTLRAEVELAAARLEERSLRAPRAGRIRDLRLRPGQAVNPGDVVLSLARGPGEDGVELELLALLPGHARPQLEPGTALRLELQGYRYAYQQLVIERVGNEVLGPAEAIRLLPPGVADALRPAEPVVFVHARIPRDTFEVGGRRFAYHDGMPGRVEAKIRSERLVFTLVPALRVLFAGSGTAGGET